MFELTLKTDQPINSLTIVFDNKTPIVYSATETKKEVDVDKPETVVLSNNNNTTIQEELEQIEIDHSEILLQKMERAAVDAVNPTQQQDIDFLPAEEECF
jgi:hypothetical protein